MINGFGEVATRKIVLRADTKKGVVELVRYQFKYSDVFEVNSSYSYGASYIDYLNARRKYGEILEVGNN